MDGGSPIADDIRRFILTSIPSVPYLEAILLLRDDALPAWDAPGLARRLYLSEKVAAELLRQLHENGVAEADAQSPVLYRYAPSSETLRQMIGRLAETYAAHLVEVTHLIHSKTGKKAQHFADAFKWRKDP